MLVSCTCHLAIARHHLSRNPDESDGVGRGIQEKKVVLFGVPGAFTGVCSQAHVPGYVSKVRTLVTYPVPSPSPIARTGVGRSHAPPRLRRDAAPLAVGGSWIGVAAGGSG